MRVWLAIFLLMLPLASAQWLVSVSSSPSRTELFIVAPDSGCVYAIDGSIMGAYEFNGDRFVSITFGQGVCVPAGSVLKIYLTPRAYVSLPPSRVFVQNDFLTSVRVFEYPGHVFVSVTPEYWPALLGVLAIAFAIILLAALRRRNGTEVADTVTQILQYVASHPGCTQKDICNALGLEKYQVSRILSRLEKQGKVVRVRRGISKRVYLPEQLQ